MLGFSAINHLMMRTANCSWNYSYSFYSPSTGEKKTTSIQNILVIFKFYYTMKIRDEASSFFSELQKIKYNNNKVSQLISLRIYNLNHILDFPPSNPM